MITFTYEYDLIKVTYSIPEFSLDGDGCADGVYSHFQRFLAAVGYPIDTSETLVSINEDDELIIDVAKYHEEMDELERLRDEQDTYVCDDCGPLTASEVDEGRLACKTCGKSVGIL